MIEAEREFLIQITTLTDRSLKTYKNLLDLETEDMRGKVVLDIGSGKRLKFARQAAQEDITVISLNPGLKYPEKRDDLIPRWKQFLKKEDSDKPPAVAGICHELPIKTEAVDHVVSLLSVPFWLSEEDAADQKWLKEMIRVAKPGGKIAIRPIEHDETARKDLKDIIEKENCLFSMTKTSLKITKPDRQDK